MDVDVDVGGGYKGRGGSRGVGGWVCISFGWTEA